MADDFHEVKITESAEEAFFFHDNKIPYIVWLNDRNQDSSFPDGAYCVEQLSDIDTQYLDRVYRRFKGIPWDIAETQRLRIREIAVEDVEQLYVLYEDERLEYREGFDGLELGYMLGVKYQHKGYAYEACSAILSYGVSELEQKEYCSFVDRRNTPSIRLCQRLGFVPNGSVRLREMNFDGLMTEKEYLQYVYRAC